VCCKRGGVRAVRMVGQSLGSLGELYTVLAVTCSGWYSCCRLITSSGNAVESEPCVPHEPASLLAMQRGAHHDLRLQVLGVLLFALSAAAGGLPVLVQPPLRLHPPGPTRESLRLARMGPLGWPAWVDPGYCKIRRQDPIDKMRYTTHVL